MLDIPLLCHTKHILALHGDDSCKGDIKIMTMYGKSMRDA